MSRVLDDWEPPTGRQESKPEWRAPVTGLCNDLGGFKPLILRALATRSPYFHNDAAETIEDVVNYYDVIFDIHRSRQECADLAAPSRSLATRGYLRDWRDWWAHIVDAMRDADLLLACRAAVRVWSYHRPREAAGPRADRGELASVSPRSRVDRPRRST
jgi:hypothetical protein